MLDNITCKGCPLEGQPFVFGQLFSGKREGLRNVKMVLIGEAPGEEEAKQGSPFIGKSGKLLRSIASELMQKYGLSEDEVYITNIVKCRPPNNRTPSKVEVEKCKYFLDQELRMFDSKKVIIVCLGNTAKDWFRIGGNIVNARGSIRETKYGKVLVTWHPAARTLYMRDALGIRDVDRMRGDLDNAVRFASTGEIARYADYIAVDNGEDLQRLISEVAGERYAIDFETTGLGIFEKGFKVLCYSIATQAGNNYVVDVDKLGEDKARKILQAVWSIGRPLMFNASFDACVAKKFAGIEFRDDIDDLQFLYYLVNGGRLKNFFTLKNIAMEFTEYGAYGLEEEELRDLRQIDRQKMWKYCATDSRVTLDMFNTVLGLTKNSRLEWESIFGDNEQTIYDAYNRLCGAGSYFISELKYNGMAVDFDYLSQLMRDMEKRISEIEQKATDVVGKINLNSQQQVMRVMNDRGIPVSKTGKDILLEYANDEFVKLLLEYREITKLYRTYIVGMIDKGALSDTGYLHANFSLVATATGRMSSSDPNMQNIPTRIGNLIEKAFVSRFGENGVIVKADMSQHELRVATIYSKDKNMAEAYRAGRDLHTEVAMKVYGLKESDVGTKREKELRRLAKGFNFGVLYGRGVKSLAFELGISEEEAIRLKTEYFNYFSGLSVWLDRVREFGQRHGYVRTMFGRVRYVSNNEDEVNEGSIIVNTPIQSAASDIAVLIGVGVMKELKARGMQSKVVNFIHDAILVDCTQEEVEEVVSIIKEEVKTVELPTENVINLRIDVEKGRSWGEVGE